MKMIRSAGISLVMILFSAPLVRGQDLSKYRNFSLGMSLPELSNQVDLRPLRTKLIQKHPAVVDRKSTRLNSSHGYISYAVFCLKKKKRVPVLPSLKDLHAVMRRIGTNDIVFPGRNVGRPLHIIAFI